MKARRVEFALTVLTVLLVALMVGIVFGAAHGVWLLVAVVALCWGYILGSAPIETGDLSDLDRRDGRHG